MNKCCFSYVDMINDLKNRNLIRNINYSYGSILLNDNDIIVNLLDHYGISAHPCDYIGNGITSIHCPIEFFDNKLECDMTIEKRIYSHSFYFIPDMIEIIYSNINNNFNDILPNNFEDNVINMGAILLDYSSICTTYLFPLKNKNHYLKLLIYHDKNVILKMVFLYNKKGSSLIYRLFSTNIINASIPTNSNQKSTYLYFHGLSLSEASDIISVIYNEIKNGYVPVLPKALHKKNSFGYNQLINM